MDPIPYIHELVGTLLQEEALRADADWTSLGVIGAVEPGMQSLDAYRFSGPTGIPVATPLREQALFDALVALRENSTGPNGRSWDMCVIKFDRASGQSKIDYLYGDETDRWRIRPDNFEEVTEALRFGPSDFAEFETN